MLITVIRTIVMYCAVIVCMRIMGKRQIGDMQPGELVVTILISEIASLPIQDIDQPVLAGVTCMFTLVILEVVLSMVSLKFGRARALLNGRPVILINDGKVDCRAMRRVRVNVDDLLSALRQQDVFNIEDVRYAIMETNGQLSVLLRKRAQTVTVADAKLKVKDSGLPVPAVCDGRRQSEFMSATGLDSDKLMRTLDKLEVEEKDIFLLTIDGGGSTYVIRRGDEG